MDLKEILKNIKSQKDRKFDESIDVALSVSTAKGSESNLKAELNVPHQFGEAKKILVLAKKNEASGIDADFVGLEEYVEKIKDGWREFDVVIATPTVMPKIAILGKYLGSLGLMPNPKTGTVTKDLAGAVKEFKAGKLNVKSNKSGQLYISVGKKSMKSEDLQENAEYVIKAITEAAGGNNNIKSVYVKSSMGKSYRLM